MNEFEEIQRSGGYGAYLPAHVRHCKDLEPNAKLFYAEISALCNMKGFCWASNAFFEQLFGVTTRTIQNWLESLQKHKFIVVEIEKIGFNTSRKIYTSDSYFHRNSNNSYDVQKISPPPAKKCTHSIQSYPTREKLLPEPEKPKPPTPKQAPSGVVVSFGDLKIGETKKQFIKKKFTIEQITIAIERVLKMNNRDSDEACLLFALNHPDEWVDSKSPEVIMVENDKYLRSIKNLDNEIVNHTRISVGYNYVEFYRGSSFHRKFLTSQKDFIEKVQDTLKEIGYKSKKTLPEKTV